MGKFVQALSYSFLLWNIYQCSGENSSTENVTTIVSINGEGLINLGRRIHKPMLTLIGMAIRNLHKCAEWTAWTPCTARELRNFGIRKRNRTCAPDLESTEDIAKKEMETDVGICEGMGEIPAKLNCPSDYNMTSNNYCLKVYTTAKRHIDAERQCQQDGGYLINVDSEKKYADVKTILTGGPVDTYVGGRQKGSTEEWEFLYGENNSFYKDKWHSCCPRSLTTHGCLLLERFLWVNVSCQRTFPFLCEIVKKEK